MALPWKRKVNVKVVEQEDLQRHPFHVRVNPPIISDIYDPESENPDMRTSLDKIGQSPETIRRQNASLDINDSMFNRGEDDKHYSEILFSRRRGAVLKREGQAEGSHNTYCRRCGKSIEPTKTKLDYVNFDGVDYPVHSKFTGGCRQADTQGNPEGARRIEH